MNPGDPVIEIQNAQFSWSCENIQAKQKSPTEPVNTKTEPLAASEETSEVESKTLVLKDLNISIPEVIIIILKLIINTQEPYYSVTES